MEMQGGSIFILDYNTGQLLTAYFSSITLDQLAFFSPPFELGNADIR